MKTVETRYSTLVNKNVFEIHLFQAKSPTNTLHIYVLNQNTLQLYLCYTKLAYLRSAKLEQLILCLMHFNYAEVVLKSN